MLVTTHYLDEAEHCHRIAIIQAGKLAALGTATELKQVFASRPIVEIHASQPVAGDGSPRRTADSREDQPVRHRRPRRAADASHGSGAVLAAALQRRGIDVASIGAVSPSLEDVFLDVVERVGSGVMRTDAGRRVEGAAADRSRSADAADPAVRAGVLPAAVRLRAQLRHSQRAGWPCRTAIAARKSRELVSSFVNSGYFELVGYVDSTAEISTAWSIAGEARARSCRFPSGFERDLSLRRPVTVQVIIDGDNANTASTVMGYARTLIGADSSAQMQVRLTLACPSVAGSRFPSISVEPRIWYNPQLRSTLFLVPGLIAYISMITAVVSTALSVVREKERGTMEQVRMAPVSPLSYIIGKTLPYLVISFVSALLIILSAMAAVRPADARLVAAAVPARSGCS